jgi:hypothetical protein
VFDSFDPCTSIHDGLIAVWIALLLLISPAPLFLYSRLRTIRGSIRHTNRSSAWRILWQVEMPRLFGPGHKLFSWLMAGICILFALSLVGLPLYLLALSGGECSVRP